MIDLSLFIKAPEGAFETVVPSERTKISVTIRDGSVHISGEDHPGGIVLRMGEVQLETEIVGQAPETILAMAVTDTQALFLDDLSSIVVPEDVIVNPTLHGVQYWTRRGYALLAEINDLSCHVSQRNGLIPATLVTISNISLNLHACADTLPGLTHFIGSLLPPSDNQLSPIRSRGDSYLSNIYRLPIPEKPVPMHTNTNRMPKKDLMASLDERAFTRPPDLGTTADMINDDLPRNLDYLDSSYGLAGGVRELEDDMFEFDEESNEPEPDLSISPKSPGIISNLGGETIRMLDERGIHVTEGHFESILPESESKHPATDTKFGLRVENCNLSFCLYDGYDWVRTRQIIEDEIKAIRKRLVKIRQLLASGQVPDDSIEHTSALLFNSVPIGLLEDPEDMERDALLAAIDEELADGATTDNASESSWQSFKPVQGQDPPQKARNRSRNLERSRNSQLEFRLSEVHADVQQFHPNKRLASGVLLTVKDLEIIDNMKTSTWKKFLTSLRTDFRGNVRETDSDMVRVELRIVHPAPELPNEEARLKAKILPIKLHVDQDALDFLKRFFSFQSPHRDNASDGTKEELYFQHVEVFPVDLKLDYKPKRVDYKALREGKTIELMNFFHFDGAEITLRHITLAGITGWPRLFDTLNDLWTPDVKANQLADIISGVSPVRSLVNVGSGVADLVLLPIAQYKKDKRLVRGLQKGTTSFVKTTAMEAVKLGARLATGTQIILEQAETVLGGQGQFRDQVTAEALNSPVGSYSEEDAAELISKFADQPQDVREGIQSAYRSLSRNLNSAAQTILAVPMEVYERSGNEGPVRAVVRAVPIAVLKPMIGATEAVSKTLIGLRNTMDPEVKHETEAKYKQR
ncbi:hypothetical protein M422DRAFT_252242 [Sphaerobolus stellatus SS14]|uniref:Autophagy-related protein 2 n=1 Tax=Sphaerobolus stellatus (strain SS14) TaxID=990650 RepID=A0A0C9W030_SPHS4|nr:hypothetical protein M422DRAFT_252242 [Sphaerobolus stellatus SS14]